MEAFFKVKVTSKDMIKPSSLTQSHLKTLQLALTDQLTPPIHMPFIFFYPNSQINHTINNTGRTNLLKKSLSDTLVHFYPLAGRIQGNLLIDCNDEGAEFYEAWVSATLSEVMDNANPDELIKLLPFAPVTKNKYSIVAAFQFNTFTCGGVAISMSVSHKIADAGTYVSFINAWSLIAQGGNLVTTPNFTSPSVFPPRELNGIFNPEDLLHKGKITTKRILFDKEVLHTLKMKASLDDSAQIRPPSRAGVVCAFLWKRFIEIAKAKQDPPKVYLARQTVNIRNTKSTPLNNNCLGNLFWFSIADYPILSKTETKYTELIGRLKEAAKQVDETHIEKIKTGECLKELPSESDVANVEICGFSSCVTFPLYEANFGWGKPIWVAVTSIPAKNMVFLYNTRCGEGIEAWVNMPAEDVHMLERDPEFLSLTSSKIRARL